MFDASTKKQRVEPFQTHSKNGAMGRNNNGDIQNLKFNKFLGEVWFSKRKENLNGNYFHLDLLLRNSLCLLFSCFVQQFHIAQIAWQRTRGSAHGGKGGDVYEGEGSSAFFSIACSAATHTGRQQGRGRGRFLSVSQDFYHFVPVITTARGADVKFQNFYFGT